MESPLTVTSRLGVLAREIDALADAAAAVRHDAQTALHDRRHHRHVRTVPQQLPVSDGVMRREARVL